MILEWIITSSVLIVIVTLLRYLFKGKISLRLQYALWALVLVRLLFPFNFGSSQLSAANITPALTHQLSIRSEITVDQLDDTVSDLEDFDDPLDFGNEESMQYMQGVHHEQQEEITQIPQTQTISEDPSPVDLISVLPYAAYGVWLLGAMIVGFWFLYINLKFRFGLRNSRKDLEVDGNGLQVFFSDYIDTPCLFGMLHPAIYLNGEATEDPKILRHSVMHESTHYRHGDHIWTVLRCICLMVHWFNPLVWCAAILSQRDAELACDEAIIHKLDEQERAEYGRTLIHMTCEKRSNFLVAATTMTASKKGIRERIVLIARKPKMAVLTLLIVLLISAITVGCTFTGGKKPSEETTIDNTAETSKPISAVEGSMPESEVTKPDDWTEPTLPKADAWTEPTMQKPVTMDEFIGIKAATLEWNGTHTVTDTAALKLLENRLSRSDVLVSGASCPFSAQLTLEFEDGRTETIFMATDNCAAWTRDGTYYRYSILTEEGYTKNTEFYMLFSADVIHELSKTDIDRFGSFLPYLDFSRYEEKYGSEEMFALMDTVKKLVVDDPEHKGLWTALDLSTGHGLDGAYADYYAGILSDLFEADKSGFAWECLGNAPDKVEETVVYFLAYEWGVTAEDARHILEAEIPKS